MKNWGVEHTSTMVGGQSRATLRCEHGQVTVEGGHEAVDALVAALTALTASAEAPVAEEPRRVLRVVLADGKGGNAAMIFEFPAGHELTVADINQVESFTSDKFKATMIALAWHWLPVPTAEQVEAMNGAEEASTEPVFDLADPPSIEDAPVGEGRKPRAVASLVGDSERPS